MSGEIESTKITLSTGQTFKIVGPQGDHAICFGTIGEDVSFSNDLLERYCERFGDAGSRSDLDSERVTALACSSSPWLLLQFPNVRRDEVVANLEQLLAKAG